MNVTHPAEFLACKVLSGSGGWGGYNGFCDNTSFELENKNQGVSSFTFLFKSF